MQPCNTRRSYSVRKLLLQADDWSLWNTATSRRQNKLTVENVYWSIKNPRPKNPISCIRKMWLPFRQTWQPPRGKKSYRAHRIFPPNTAVGSEKNFMYEKCTQVHKNSRPRNPMWCIRKMLLSFPQTWQTRWERKPEKNAVHMYPL